MKNLSLLCASVVTIFSIPSVYATEVGNQSACVIEYKYKDVVDHRCSGTVVAKNLLLTAGHCIALSAEYMDNGPFQTQIRCVGDSDIRVPRAAILYPSFQPDLQRNAGLSLLSKEPYSTRLKDKDYGQIRSDIGFYLIKSETPFAGPFPKIVSDKEQFKRFTEVNNCTLTGYRAGLDASTSVNIENPKYARKVSAWPTGQTIENTLNPTVEPAIWHGDSGAGITCVDGTDFAVAATVSGFFSPAVTLYQNRHFIDLVLGSTEEELVALSTIPVNDSPNLKSATRFLIQAKEFKITHGISIECGYGLADAYHYDRCASFMTVIKSIADGASVKNAKSKLIKIGSAYSYDDTLFEISPANFKFDLDHKQSESLKAFLEK